MGIKSFIIVVAISAIIISSTIDGKKMPQRKTYYPPNGPAINQKVWLEMTSEIDYELKVQLTYTDALAQCPTDGSAPPPPNNYYITPSKAIQEKVGVKTVGINWNPCGHPDFKYWGSGHFDLHMYLWKDAQYRWTCGKFPDNPYCLPNNPAATPFFKPVTENMPKGFIPDSVGVANMGLHHFVPPTTLSKDWKIPALILGSYNGEVIFFESMFPKKTFTDSVKDSQMLVYQNQTNFALPHTYKMDADSTTMTAVVTFVGQINVQCGKLDLETCVLAKKCQVSANGKRCEAK